MDTELRKQISPLNIINFEENFQPPQISNITHNLKFEIANNSEKEVDVAREHNLRSINEIPLPYREIFYKYPYFNKIQSNVFNDVFYSDEPFVVSAPTGSGKTVLFELAIVRLLISLEKETSHEPFKIIYVAPMKALCEERLIDWHQKFGKFGLTSISVTGDSDNVDFQSLLNHNLIITTPEKWDSLTRKWKDNQKLVELVKLFMVDEVHLLNEESRGPTLEAVVSRMKTIQSTLQQEYYFQRDKQMKKSTRFLALSATIPNIEDIAEWLSSKDSHAKYFRYGEETRPVPLKRIVLGYPYNPQLSSPFKFDIALSYKIQSIILQHAQGKPTLIFCSTRKSVEMTSKFIVQNVTIYLNGDQQRVLLEAAASIHDSHVQEILVHGVGYHHAGLDPENRRTIESLFRNGHLPILVTTSTLAMGVNLPAHLVIIKSTKYYAKGGYQDYSESTLLQMIGRAGRPQFDTSATAVIMTTAADKQKYENMLGGKQPVESNLHKHLTEHLNAEVVLQTITHLEVAMEWVTSTFLRIRARKNPKHYGIPLGLTADQIDKKLLDMCQIEINKLAKANMLKLDIDQNLSIQPTSIGQLMAKYLIAFDTMKLFLQVSGKEVLRQILTIISKCQEFSDMYLRVNDKKTLNLLNKCRHRETIRFPLSGKIKTLDMKINCLIQAVFGCLPIVEPSLVTETQKIMRIGERVSKCLAEYLETKKNCYSALLNAVILAKCFHVRLWENSPFVLKQLPGIGVVLTSYIVSAGKTTFQDILDTNPRDIERILKRKPPLGNEIQDKIKHLPQYSMSLEVIETDKIKSVDVVVTMTNVNDLGNQLTCQQKSFMTLIVGDDLNNVLLYEKYTVAFFKENSKMVINVHLMSENTKKVFADFISDDWVGFDAKATLKFSSLVDKNSDNLECNKRLGESENKNQTSKRNISPCKNQNLMSMYLKSDSNTEKEQVHISNKGNIPPKEEKDNAQKLNINTKIIKKSKYLKQVATSCLGKKATVPVKKFKNNLNTSQQLTIDKFYNKTKDSAKKRRSLYNPDSEPCVQIVADNDESKQKPADSYNVMREVPPQNEQIKNKNLETTKTLLCEDVNTISKQNSEPPVIHSETVNTQNQSEEDANINRENLKLFENNNEKTNILPESSESELIFDISQDQINKTTNLNREQNENFILRILENMQKETQILNKKDCSEGAINKEKSATNQFPLERFNKIKAGTILQGLDNIKEKLYNKPTFIAKKRSCSKTTSNLQQSAMNLENSLTYNSEKKIISSLQQYRLQPPKKFQHETEISDTQTNRRFPKTPIRKRSADFGEESPNFNKSPKLLYSTKHENVLEKTKAISSDTNNIQKSITWRSPLITSPLRKYSPNFLKGQKIQNSVVKDNGEPCEDEFNISKLTEVSMVSCESGENREILMSSSKPNLRTPITSLMSHFPLTDKQHSKNESKIINSNIDSEKVSDVVSEEFLSFIESIETQAKNSSNSCTKSSNTNDNNNIVMKKKQMRSMCDYYNLLESAKTQVLKQSSTNVNDNFQSHVALKKKPQNYTNSDFNNKNNTENVQYPIDKKDVPQKNHISKISEHNEIRKQDVAEENLEYLLHIVEEDLNNTATRNEFNKLNFDVTNQDQSFDGLSEFQHSFFSQTPAPKEMFVNKYHQSNQENENTFSSKWERYISNPKCNPQHLMNGLNKNQLCNNEEQKTCQFPKQSYNVQYNQASQKPFLFSDEIVPDHPRNFQKLPNVCFDRNFKNNTEQNCNIRFNEHSTNNLNDPRYFTEKINSNISSIYSNKNQITQNHIHTIPQVSSKQTDNTFFNSQPLIKKFTSEIPNDVNIIYEGNNDYCVSQLNPTSQNIHHNMLRKCQCGSFGERNMQETAKFGLADNNLPNNMDVSIYRVHQGANTLTTENNIFQQRHKLFSENYNNISKQVCLKEPQHYERKLYDDTNRNLNNTLQFYKSTNTNFNPLSNDYNFTKKQNPYLYSPKVSFETNDGNLENFNLSQTFYENEPINFNKQEVTTKRQFTSDMQNPKFDFSKENETNFSRQHSLNSDNFTLDNLPKKRLMYTNISDTDQENLFNQTNIPQRSKLWNNEAHQLKINYENFDPKFHHFEIPSSSAEIYTGTQQQYLANENLEFHDKNYFQHFHNIFEPQSMKVLSDYQLQNTPQHYQSRNYQQNASNTCPDFILCGSTEKYPQNFNTTNNQDSYSHNNQRILYKQNLAQEQINKNIIDERKHSMDAIKSHESKLYMTPIIYRQALPTYTTPYNACDKQYVMGRYFQSVEGQNGQTNINQMMQNQIPERQYIETKIRYEGNNCYPLPTNGNAQM